MLQQQITSLYYMPPLFLDSKPFVKGLNEKPVEVQAMSAMLEWLFYILAPYKLA